MTVIFSYEHVSKVRLKKVHFDCLREYRVSNLGQELDFRRVESYGWGGARGVTPGGKSKCEAGSTFH